MNVMSRLISVTILALAVTSLPAQKPTEAAFVEEDGARPLFNGKDLTGWVNVNCHPGTFFVKDGEIVTTGNPTGFLRTEKQYENFVLDFDWMHVEPTKMANSGLFVWGDPLPAVGTPYTRGIEVQVLINFAPKDGWATSHGDVFSIHGARCKPDRPHPTRKGMERCLPSENRVKGAGEWNHYKVKANNGVLKLEVNGKEVSGVSQCTPRKGYLALESEGSECHFKNIRIKELPSTNPKPEETAKVAEGHVSLFNGLDLKGWKTEEGAWKVTGGKFVAANLTGRSSDESLVSERKFDKCELVFDWRFSAKSKGPMRTRVGPYFTTVFPDGNTTNSVLEDLKLVAAPGEKIELKPGAWNRSIIKFDGNLYSWFVNGTCVGTFKPGKAETLGPIILQTTMNPDKAIEGLEFMNVFVRELKEKK
jgi:hypothetical protein